MISRRTVLVTIVGGIVAVPFTIAAQPPANIRRIGVLSPFVSSDTRVWHQAFRDRLRDLGWLEGQNISIEYRSAEGRPERLPDLAADLVRLKLDLIVTAVSDDTRAAKRATTEIPIVMVSVGDPIADGVVQSLARPGGNVTGLSQMAPELGKRLELLQEIVPKLSRVAVLWNPLGRGSTNSWNEIQVAARTRGIQLQSLEVRSANEFDKAFEDATLAHAGAVAIMPAPLFVTSLRRLAGLAAKKRLPSIFHIREFVDAGGLIAYGADRAEMYRRAAIYVDKILRGAKPGDLPIEQPTKFELVINAKTAKALGLTIPPSLLLRADQVIE